MNTQKKKPGTFHLQAKNNRWKWMVGATAAGVTASQAGTITVNLLNNYISVDGGNHLNADLTGDGHPDLTIANAFTAAYLTTSGRGGRYTARVNLNGVRATAFFGFTAFGHITVYAQLGTQFRFNTSAIYPLIGSIPIFFKDLHINGGKPTAGSLEVTVNPEFAGDPTIRLDSFTYTSNTLTSNTLDHTSSVPDHGSSLALLAMGAGGVLALRRLRAGQERSRD